MMKAYGHHKYTWSKPYGSVRHSWSLIGAYGAVEFHVSVTEGYGRSCGLEIHYAAAPDYMQGQAPSQTDCWLLHGRCWHDGTSLYAEETLWPRIEGYLRSGAHESIFALLEGEADTRFADAIDRAIAVAREPLEA